MTLQIELDPATEARLTAEARDKGLELPTYASDLLRASASPAKEPKPPPTVEEFRAMLDEFARLAPDLSHLRDETFSRSMIYSDHD